MATTRLFTLGGCRVECDQTVVALPPLALSILAYLAAGQKGHATKDELVLLFWDGVDMPRSRHNLSQALHSLRRLLPNLKLEVNRQNLLLKVRSVHCDAAEFETAVRGGDLATAANLYRGEFLKGHVVSGRREFRFWVEQRGSALARQARDTFLQLAREAEDDGRWTEVQASAERLLSVDPLDSVGRILLANARAAQGDTRAALGLLGKINRQDRRQKVGVTRRAVMEIANRYHQLTSASNLALASSSVPFVGRVAEIRQLISAWEEVVNRLTSGFALLSGEAGIGKSRLLDHVARLVAIRGGRVLFGRCRALERRLPYAALADVLSSNVRPTDLQLLSQSELETLIRVVPSLDLGRRGAGCYTAELPPVLAVYDAAVALLRQIALSRPLLVIVDDAHWADEGTLIFFQYATRRLREAPVLFLVGLRQEEAGNPNPFYSCLVDAGVSKLLDIAPLDDDAVKQLIRVFGASVGVRVKDVDEQTLADRSKGRPLFVLESLRQALPLLRSGNATLDFSVHARFSASLREHVAQRLATLTERSRLVISALAVLNAATVIDELAAILHLDGDTILSSLREAETRAALVLHSETGIAFTHDLLRQCIYASIPSSLRLLLHTRAAEYLARQARAPDGVIAEHYHAAGQRDAAFAFALQAAMTAFEAGAFADAEHYVNIASTCAADPEALNRAADVRFRVLIAANRPAEVIPMLERLESWYIGNRDGDGLLRVAVVRLQVALLGHAHVNVIRQHFDDFCQMVDSTQDLTLAGQYVTSMAGAAHHSGRADLIAELLPRLFHRGSAPGVPRGRVEALALAARLHCVYGEPELAWEAANAADRIAAESGDALSLLLAATAKGVTELIYGNIESARLAYVHANALSQRPGLGRYVERTLGDYGWVLMERGLVVEAEEVLYDAIRRLGNQRALFAIGNLCNLYYSIHQWNSLKDAATHLLDANSVLQAEWAELAAHSFGGIAALHLGDGVRQQQAWAAVSRLTSSQRMRLSDSWIAGIFTAAHLRELGRFDDALNVLTNAIERCKIRDRLARWRFELELAGGAVGRARGKPYELCERIEASARACGALLIAGEAQRLKQLCV